MQWPCWAPACRWLRIVAWERARIVWGHGSGWLARLAVLPGTTVALVLAALAVYLLKLPVETIESRFGGIPASLPTFALPAFDWSTVRFLLVPASTLAVLGAIKSLLCARVADNFTRDRHDPNQELMAQGVANFLTPFFGGMPATGMIARTVTNIKSGATSPISGIVHAATIFELLARQVAPRVSESNGRPGMTLWTILVCGVIRLDLNIDFDRLHELVNHRDSRNAWPWCF